MQTDDLLWVASPLLIMILGISATVYASMYRKPGYMVAVLCCLAMWLAASIIWVAYERVGGAQ